MARPDVSHRHHLRGYRLPNEPKEKGSGVRIRFRVFDRVVTVGAEIEPGKKADKNYLWLSEWHIENINNNYLLPVDFDTYKQLRNHISKALAPLLHIWLYASKKDGCFEKRYDELRDFGYLSRWEVGRTVSDRAFKIAFYHGEKFTVRRLEEGNGKDAQNRGSEHKVTDASLKAELTKRGISDRKGTRAPQ